MEINSILAPVVPVGDQLQSLAFQRMMWMDDLKGSAVTIAMRGS
jgi:hypothetical protein